jgi:hypothetical protein
MKQRAGKQSAGPPALRLLLLCGILSSLLYAAMNISVPLFYSGYSSSSQTISELSAIGAPTRSLWIALGSCYTLLVTAFGWGVWTAAGTSTKLRVVGGVMVAYGLSGILWFFAPMHQREVLAAGGGTIEDIIHLVMSGVTGLLYLTALGFGAAALGKRFRAYSFATMALLLGSCVLMSRDGPKVQMNLPTPWIGVTERIMLGVVLLWIAVLSVALLRRKAAQYQKPAR